MANGKPGDHPLTDILNWKTEVFGPEADNLIREIVRLGGERRLETPPLNLLALDPRYNASTDLDSLTRALRNLRDALRADAEARGWEME